MSHPQSLDFDAQAAAFCHFYLEQEESLRGYQETLTDFLTEVLAQSSFVEVSKVEGRVKDMLECVQKFTRKYRPALEERNRPYAIAPYITDLVGVRVVCLYEDEIEKIADLLKRHFDVMDITDKVSAVEGTESSFGYKGLHLDLRPNATTAALPQFEKWESMPFELQLRTIVQDSWSVLDHKIKYKKSIPKQLKRRINVLSALFELADREFLQIRDATEAEMRHAPDETALIAEEGKSAQPTQTPSAHSNELNAFSFLKIGNHFFKDYAFEPFKVDGFVDEIHSWDPDITRARFNSLVRENIGQVKRYKQFFEEQTPQGKLNAYTVIRHCLYLGDPLTFRPALRNVARESFEHWLQSNP